MNSENCVVVALSELTGFTVEQVKEAFDWPHRRLYNGDPIPPDIHEVIDYLWELGYYATVIHRFPRTEFPDGSLHSAYPRQCIEKERWAAWTSETGLMLAVDLQSKVRHMYCCIKGEPLSAQPDHMHPIGFIAVGRRPEEDDD